MLQHLPFPQLEGYMPIRHHESIIHKLFKSDADEVKQITNCGNCFYYDEH
jgi:hypothetical protein